jgi:hypothetical protein
MKARLHLLALCGLCGVQSAAALADVAISWFCDVANNTASNLLVKVSAICSKSSDALVAAAPLKQGSYRLTVAIRSGRQLATTTAPVTLETRGG